MVDNLGIFGNMKFVFLVLSQNGVSMKYDVTVKELTRRIREHYPQAQDQMEQSSVRDLIQGIDRPHFLPVYILWMLKELETFEDREKAARWLGWIMGKVDGITVLHVATFQETRALVKADKERQPFKKDEYPKFLMKIGDKQFYLPVKQAGRAYDNGFVEVRIIGDVLEQDGNVRPITEKERQLLADIAEDYSASK